MNGIIVESFILSDEEKEKVLVIVVKFVNYSVFVIVGIGINNMYKLI